MLLPLLREQRVDRRPGGRPSAPAATSYEAAEIDALAAAGPADRAGARCASRRPSACAQREREFTELKRFFPPQIIDR